MAKIADANIRFRRWLGVVVAGGLVIRIIAAIFFDDRTRIGGDAVWYLGIARFLPRGIGFVEPLQYEVLNTRFESAAHPPLYPIFLSVVDAIGLHSTLAHRIWSAVPGAITILLVGLIGRRLAGRRAGLVAAVCAAGSLPLIVQDVNLWSEGMYGMTIVLVVWSALLFLRRRDLLGVVILAAAICISALTRAESALLFVLLLLPLVVRVMPRGVQRWRCLGAAAVTAVALFGPWFAYNTTRFEEPVVLSTGLGGLVASSNCPSTYNGAGIGGWGSLCARGMPDPLPTDESKIDLAARRVAFRFAADHADRLPAVIPVRLLRTFGFWKPVSNAAFDLQFDSAGIGWAAHVAVAQYWGFLGLGAVGLVSLRRRGRPLLPFIAPIATAVVITIIGYGTLRFRIAFDAILPILVGVGATALWDRARFRRPPAGPPERGTDSPSGTLDPEHAV